MSFVIDSCDLFCLYLVKICILQLNYRVCDLVGNSQKIVEAVRRIEREHSIDLFITSELSAIGYPPKDYLLNRAVVESVGKTIDNLATTLKSSSPILIGGVEFNESGMGKPLFNSIFLLRDGDVVATVRKRLLPNYDVFDEMRYFESSQSSQILKLGGRKIGVTICEDIWNDSTEVSPIYRHNPLEEIRQERADLIVNTAASPFSVTKPKRREALLSETARRSKTPVVGVNQVGGNDELIFDGTSCAFDSAGRLLARAKAFEEDFLIVHVDSNLQNRIEPILCESESLYEALVAGTRDYIRKCGFKRALLGLSGGIDSALTAAIAAAAIGPENVLALLMPSPYSSRGSIEDALHLSKNLGIATETIPIETVMRSFDGALKDLFAGRDSDVTEENIQARIRGTILMAVSNKYNSILLATGNKSELAVGYCTIYGDMCGGLAVIADLPKTMVYRLAEWINEKQGESIPKSIIAKPPSAELRPNQRDRDSLPDYRILDEILELMIENHCAPFQIVKKGYKKEIVDQIAYLVKRAEFKRKQAAPGLKVTDRAFGTGWRMPIAVKQE